MVNEFITLLLNTNPPPMKVDLASFIDPVFKPLKLTTGLKEIHSVLFDDASSYWDKVYYAHQLNKLMYSRKYSVVYAVFDPRRTKPQSSLFSLPYGLQAVGLNNNLPLFAQHTEIDYRPPVYRKYRIDLRSSNVVAKLDALSGIVTTIQWSPGDVVRVTDDYRVVIPTEAVIGNSWDITIIVPDRGYLHRLHEKFSTVPSAARSELFYSYPSGSDEEVLSSYYLDIYQKSTLSFEVVLGIVAAYVLRLKYLQNAI